MSLDLQYVGMEVCIASDAPSYIAKQLDGKKYQVVDMKRYHSCQFPTYILMDADGVKITFNGLYLDFVRWLPNKQPVFKQFEAEDDFTKFSFQ